MLTNDAIWDMPPFTGWYQGTGAIGTLISTLCPADRAGRHADAAGDRQRAAGLRALHARGRRADARAFQIQQLELREGRVAHVVAYFDTSLFATFGLPEVLPA